MRSQEPISGPFAPCVGNLPAVLGRDRGFIADCLARTHPMGTYGSRFAIRYARRHRMRWDLARATTQPLASGQSFLYYLACADPIRGQDRCLVGSERSQTQEVTAIQKI